MNNHKIDLNKESIFPKDIKKMSIDELYDLASNIRDFLITNISVTGGHLSSNLGACEAIIALHYVFDSPFDKLIFDVGHQAYVHKILTGRSPLFSNLRSLSGISGFLKYSESIHDVFECGHSSTSISALCGFLKEKETNDEIGEVVAFIGDASIQNGLALSSINYLASQEKQKGIIVINDNEMSISKNHGGLTNIFNRIRIKKSYRFFSKLTPKSVRNALKSFVYNKERLFSQLGFTYIGPIDGHNLKEMIKYFRFAKENNKTTIIHIKTIKGKGYSYSEKDTLGVYHSIPPFDVTTGKIINETLEDMIPFNEGIASIIEDTFKENKKLKMIIPAMVYGLAFTNLLTKYPDRVIDVGICEENAVVMASAIARCGSIPIVSTYATFFQRAYDEINHDVTRPDNHVIFIADRAGIIGGDGDTHQGTFDLSMIISLPNIIIAAPSSLDDFYGVFDLAIKASHPFYIRYPKVNVQKSFSKTELKGYEWKIVRDIKDKNIITYGPVINKIDNLLTKKNANIGLINALFILPIDTNTMNKLRNTTIYIYEEVIKQNSLYTLLTIYNNEHKLNMNIISYSLDDYVTDGKASELYDKYHLSITEFINDIIL